MFKQELDTRHAVLSATLATRAEHLNKRFGSLTTLFPSSSPILAWPLDQPIEARFRSHLRNTPLEIMVALRFALNDLVEIIRFGGAETSLMPRLAPRKNPLGLANRKSGRIDLNSLYGETDVRGDVASRLNRCLRSTWDRAKLGLVSGKPYLGASGDLLRLIGISIGDSASLSESFFERLPTHLKHEFYQDGDLQMHRAILPDRRNDGNLLLSQFHYALARFHNCSVDYLDQKLGHPRDRETTFNHARSATRTAFHDALLKDVLPQLCEEQVLEQTLWQTRAQNAREVPLEGVLLLETLIACYPWPTITPNAGCSRLRVDEQTNRCGDGLPKLLFNSAMLPTRLSQSFAVDWKFITMKGCDPSDRTESLHQVPRHLQDSSFASGEEACKAAGFQFNRRAGSKKTPLISYVLNEATEFGQNGRLGPLGSFIVARTLCGAMNTCRGKTRHRSAPYVRGQALRALLEPPGTTHDEV